ncbi:hypothetical protein [Isoptericola croceus]|uniref:hypothetical protein n=1 Tax=Isoptericola croceus TaxID=3031406 RepID=UPI0023F91EAA|nr:hypothetical protein [Isoptericola croceus]
MTAVRAADLLRAWSALAEELDGERDAVERFVLAWVGRLEERLTDVGYALAAGDRDGARTGLMTVRSTSEMVGAHELAALAACALESLAARGADAAARDLMPARIVADEILRQVAVQLLVWHHRTIQEAGGPSQDHASNR